MLCCAICTRCRIFGLKCCTFGSGRHASIGRRHSPGGSRRGIVIALRIIHQTITCVYGGRFPALGTEQILPLYLGRSQDGVFAEKDGIENAVLHSQGKNALHVGSRLFIEAGGKVFVEKLVGTHVIAFVGINAGEGAQQNGKGAVTLTLHDAAHQTVVHEVCVQGEIVKSPFFDSGHGLMIRG